MGVPSILSDVPDVTPYIQYVATSGQTVFPYPFPITQDSDLVVVANGVTLSTDSGYTLSGQGNDTGGNLTFTLGRTTGDIITLYRDVAIERISQISQNSGFSSTVFNAEYNNIYLIMQQLAASIAQCLQIPNTNNPAPTTVLTPAAYANKYMAFDGNGNPEPATLTSSGVITGSSLAAILSVYTAQAVLPSYVRTAAEIAASVVPTNYAFSPGTIDRYGTNTTPGTTDMTAAVNAALAVAAAGGGAVYALATTYGVQTINWPGNNISLVGTGSGFSMDTSGTPYTKFKFLSTGGGNTVISLAQSGTAEDRQGNYLANFEIDGNGLANVGFDTALGNTFERVSVKGTLVIGAHFANFTNGNLAKRCKFSNNSGWGFRAEGSSSTTYALRDCEVISNTLGGLDLEAGVNVLVDHCDVESNGGPGVQINKPNTMTGSMLNFDFRQCWFEDNAATTPFFTVVISSGTSDQAHSVMKIRFDKCRFNAASATTKHINALVCYFVEFIDCNFDTSTASDAVTLSTNSRYVSFIGSSTGGTYSLGLSPTQLDNALAQGAYSWCHDPDVSRVVGSGSPAVDFQNSWVNYGGSNATAKYWFNVAGEVCLEGSIKSGTSGTTAFTLPAGYRPQTVKIFATSGNGAFASVTVGTDGTVVPTGSTTLLCLDGIRFPVTP